jgi:hypothetical protein
MPEFLKILQMDVYDKDGNSLIFFKLHLLVSLSPSISGVMVKVLTTSAVDP